jgi:hypothetical protein
LLLERLDHLEFAEGICHGVGVEMSERGRERRGGRTGVVVRRVTGDWGTVCEHSLCTLRQFYLREIVFIILF